VSPESPWLWESWAALCGATDTSRDVWSDLVRRWSEPHRRYHDLHHLLHVLTVVDELAREGDELRAVRLAAWFHDAVYDPRSADNETRSADLAVAALDSLRLDADLVQQVRELILMTERHDAGPQADRPRLLLHDADLAILGVPAMHYLRYVNGVRAEYAHLSDDEFTKGRIAVLQEFSGRDQIYLLPEARERYEANARTNIAAELLVYRPGQPGPRP